MRRSGLEKSGEMSVENIAYKLLRAKGYLDNLYNMKTSLIIKDLSL